MKKYNTTFSCGCVHEIEITNGVHNPTGKQEQCKKHKEVEEIESN